MDFSQFLKNSYSKKNTQKSNDVDVDKKPNQKNSKSKTKTDYTAKTSLCKLQSSVSNSNSNLDIYKNLRKGNIVKVIRLENSELNYYKGYIGEVRDYKKDQNHALIFLHARNNNVVISFPLTHLELL